MSDDPQLDYRIARLRIKPGEIVVVKLDFEMTGEQMLDTERFFAEKLGTTEILVLDKRADLSVLTPAQIKERTA